MKITVVIEEDHDGYCAYAPSLPGCVAWAPDREKLEAIIKNSIRRYLTADPDEIPTDAETIEVEIE